MAGDGDRAPIVDDGAWRPQVVVVGAAARDVAPLDPRGWRLGGGVTYGALTLARLGVATACLVGLDVQARSATELSLLTEAGARVVAVPLERGPVFENLEGPSGRIQHCRSTSDPLPVDVLPASWRDAPAWLLAPVADELPEAWARVPRPDAIVALGWQGLLRDLTSGDRVLPRAPRPSALLRRSDLVGISAQDVPPGSALGELEALLGPGAILALTMGERGGLVVRMGTLGDAAGSAGMRSYPAEPADVVDPTGAGDVFLAALLAAALVRADPDVRAVGAGRSPIGSSPTASPFPRGVGPFPTGTDLRLAASAASVSLEGIGLTGIGRLDTVRARMARPPLRRTTP